MSNSARYEQFYNIYDYLESYYGIFYSLVQMGRPSFVETVPTAAVGFDENGRNIMFIFNPKFWDELDEYNRVFVICHECLHVLLSHGLRSINCTDKRLANVAMDIVVNHMLVNNFKFDRSKIKNEKDFCWVDTVFSPNQIASIGIEENKSFEYYFNILQSFCSAMPIAGKLVDSHDQLGNISEGLAAEISEKIMGNTSKEEFDTFKEKMGEDAKETENKSSRGTVGGNIKKVIKLTYVRKKRKWESVIKRWTQRKLSEMVSVDSWVHQNRRMVTLDQTLSIPHLVDQENYEKEKINVLFFQDTSGSCVHLAPRFLLAARSIPEDRFNVKAFCFDTSTYEINLKSGELFGFGGTSFSIIEDRIQQMIASEKLKKYPDAVFVITDGEGDRVYPEKPERWHWFLSYNYRYCIPKESKVYMLDEFE